MQTEEDQSKRLWGFDSPQCPLNDGNNLEAKKMSGGWPT